MQPFSVKMLHVRSPEMTPMTGILSKMYLPFQKVNILASNALKPPLVTDLL